MRKKQSLFLGLAVGTVVIFLAVVAVGQSDRGAIAGSVVDSTGAVVSGASVTVTGVDTGAVYKAETTGSGLYRIGDVQIGTYNVTVEATGFKTSLQKGLVVQVNSVTALNVTLQPGDVKEQVTVLADAPTLQTETSDIGTVVSERQIKDLPLALFGTGQSFMRSPETFVFLTPGTTGPGTNSDASSGGIFESKLAGGQNFATEVVLDGVSTQRSDSGSAYDQTAPSVEALTEFKVLTSTIPAEFGRTTGGVESFATKSGTNTYHGTAFDLYRNDKLNANSWNNNHNGIAKPRDHQNDFGGSLGGPIRIPWLYNGHDKAFFFFSWEQYRNNQGTTNPTTLPTDLERGGDFSALLGPGLTTGGINPQPILNPCDGTQVREGQIFDPATASTSGPPCRSAFPGNIIPTARLSAVALNVLKYLPHAAGGNGPGCSQLICNNFPFASNKPVRDTTMTFKIDYNVGTKGKAFFSYSSRDQEVLNGTPALPPPLDPNFSNSNFTHYMRFGYDYAISPTLLNHFVIGFNRLANASLGESITGADWPAVLGIGNAHGKVFPQFSFEGSPLSISYQGLSTGNSDRNVPNSLGLSDGVSWVKGRHSLRFGAEWRPFQFSRLNQENTSPAYVFSNLQTAYIPNDTHTGDPFASFLLGGPKEESLTVSSVQPRWISNYYAFYVQDDFKLRSNLVLNLGLRYSVDTPRHEAHNANSVLDLTAQNSGTPGTLGALIYGAGATGAKTYYKNFGPRIGFSYSPSFRKGIVFRGGYAIYYGPLQYSDFGTAFMSGTSSHPDFPTPDNFKAVQSLDMGFPNYPPPSNNKDPNLANGQGPSYAAPEFGRPGMIQNWSFEVQQELARDLILSVGYVGMHSTRLHSWLVQVNSVNPKYYGLGTDLTLNVADPKAQDDIATLGLTVPSWFSPLWGDNATLGQLLRPHPQFGGIDTTTLENGGQSTYHALQSKLERRFRNGLNLLASYTFSKTLTNADSSFPVFSGFNSGVFGAQNAYNLKAEKSVSYQDIPHTFVLSYLYELPAGPGKKYFSHGVASKVLGGWQVGAVHRYQAGSPTRLNSYAKSPPSSVANGNFRYSLIPGVPVLSPNASQFNPFGGNSGCSENSDGTFSSRSSNNFFNCAAFLDPNQDSLVAQRGYAFGNAPPFFSGIRSPGYMNEDFSIIKRTVLTETQTLTFKVDIPNAFNRHTFAGIDGDPGSSTFGVAGGGGHGVLNSARRIQLTFRYEF